MAKFEVVGKMMLVKTVGKHGGGAVVYVPKKWIGKRVAIILDGK